MKTFKLDTKKFKKTYKTIAEEAKGDVDFMRSALAEANNCIAIGEASCYAAMVAVPKNYPDIVIKVCDDENDRFISYAKKCAKGKLVGPHYLKVYSVTRIEKGVYVIVSERLPRAVSDEGDATLKDKIWYKKVFSPSYYDRQHVFQDETASEEMKSIAKAAIELRDMFGNIDMHNGNVMRRADGTGVFIDI